MKFQAHQVANLNFKSALRDKCVRDPWDEVYNLRIKISGSKNLKCKFYLHIVLSENRPK